jgi:hypothetical protein
MRAAVRLSLFALLIAPGCHENTQGDAVREKYERQADQIDRQAAQQPTATARGIYHDQADAYREEGRDREKGLEGKEPSSGPNPPDTQPVQSAPGKTQ